MYMCETVCQGEKEQMFTVVYHWSCQHYQVVNKPRKKKENVSKCNATFTFRLLNDQKSFWHLKGHYLSWCTRLNICPPFAELLNVSFNPSKSVLSLSTQYFGKTVLSLHFFSTDACRYCMSKPDIIHLDLPSQSGIHNLEVTVSKTITKMCSSLLLHGTVRF